MKCPKCGTTNTEGDQYCSACNQPLLSAPPLPEPIKPNKIEMPREDIKTSKLAITSLVLGILGIVAYKTIPYGIIGWVGIVFGIFALNKIEKSQGCLRGKGLAIAGIIISCIAAVLSYTLIRDFFKEEDFRRIKCQANQRVIYITLLEYKKINNELPKNLSVLANEGFIEENFIYCPSKPKIPDKEKYYDKFAYLYYPENFGKKGKALISEDINNHFGEGLQPVIHQVMGDGEMVTKIIDKSKIKYP